MRRAKKHKLEILDGGQVVGFVDAEGIVHRRERTQGLQGMSDAYVPWGSIGGDIWEWLHPQQVQAEYTAVGKEPPSAADIASGAASDALDRANAGIASAMNAGQNLGRWIVIGLVAYAAIQLLSHIPKPRRS